MTIKFTKKLALIFASIFSICMFAASPLTFAASDITVEDIDACNQLDKGSLAYEAAGCNNTSDQLPTVIQNILYAIILVSGLIAVIFIIIGGVQYMTSTGDPGKVKHAKDTVLYSVIGLIVCVLAFAIVNFVINIIKSA